MPKRRIAVLGGGVGAVTAVHAIAGDPALRERYEITVYQPGWRLGGKGASGRQMDMGARILEHGLHVWAGFYDNAFRNLRACYEGLNRLGLRHPDAPLGTIEAAFEPLEHLFLAEEVAIPGRRPEWRPWLVDLPRNDLVPGTATEAPTPFGMFLALLAILRGFLADGEIPLAALSGSDLHGTLRAAHDDLHRHAQRMGAEPKHHSHRDSGLLVDLIEAAQRLVRDAQTPANLDRDPMRRTLFLLDLSLACARGMASSDAFASGYDVLDRWEFSDWLHRNGAGPQALRSVLLRGCYDFVFGYPHGRALAGDVGAGTALRAMGRLILTYRGAIFWKMRAGMGDTIFAPYYQYLSALGVRFRFFTAARRVVPDAAGTRIAALEMVEQAAPLGDGYAPLVEVKGLPSWPSEPLWDQLADGAALKASGIDFESEAEPPAGRPFTLEAGRDFDDVILGASMGSLGYLTGDLAAISPRWKRMLGSVRTVGTHAAQFWLTKPQDGLGWRKLVDDCNPGVRKPDGPLQTIITGFAEPLDTWADMTHLLGREDWGPDGPRSIAYFCSPAPEGETLDDFRRRVVQWAGEDLTALWTGAGDRGHRGFDAADLWTPPGWTGSPFDAQYCRVNMHGSERYVLSVTGSVYHRLAPGESGFANLYLAGDWTRCGLNAGCVEAAAMSGIAAAAALTGQPMQTVGADDIPSDATPRAQAMYLSASISGAPWPLAGFFARGEMNGWFLFWAMPRAEVQALLPKGLHLAHSQLVPHGLHPVGLSLCRFHNVRGSFVPDFMAMAPYGEASFAIPFVGTAETGRARFLYPRRLYVDSLPAIAAGRVFYAMDKVRARIEADDRSFRAADPAGRPFLASHFEQHDDPRPLRAHPAFGTLAAFLNLPFVTVRRDGHLLFNAFNLELDRAWAAPVSGEVSVTDTQPGGFPAAQVRAVPLGHGHAEGLPGAVRIWASWSMTNPLDGRRIRHAAAAEAFLRGTY